MGILPFKIHLQSFPTTLAPTWSRPIISSSRLLSLVSQLCLCCTLSLFPSQQPEGARKHPSQVPPSLPMPLPQPHHESICPQNTLH